MVKKLKYLLFLIPLFTFLNVNATTLNAPSVYYYQNDTPYSVSTTTDNWSSTNVYVGPYIGDFGSNTPRITRVDYNWFNLNVCSGKNVSIAGSVHAIFGFFLNQSYTLSFYMNNEQLTCSTQVFDNGNALHYDCYGEVGGGTFSIYLTENSFTANTNYHTGVSQDVSYSCDVSNEAIVNQSITNTENIINNQDENTQDIIDNQNQNTQDIIDNQNANTQAEIESQKSCFLVDKSYTGIDNHYLNSYNVLSPGTDFIVTDFININNATIKILSTYTSNDGANVCYYNAGKSLISCQRLYNLSSLTIPSDAYYIRSSIRKNNKPVYQICKNGNQALNDSVNDLNDTLKNDTPPDTENQLSELDNSLISDTPITDLITLPITLLNSYITGVGGTCTSYNLGNLYGTDLVLPCLNLQQRLGSNLWTIIDSLFSIFMIYNIAMLMIQAFEGFTSLRDDYEGLYQPRHADTGYQPKHGGDN